MGLFKSREGQQKKAENTISKECGKSVSSIAIKAHETIALGEDVTSSESSGQLLKASIPLFKGKLRTDLLQIFTISGEGTDFYLVIPWSGKIMLAHEFFSIDAGRLPWSIGLKRGELGSWGTGDWIGVRGGKEDSIATAAEERGLKLCEGLIWNWEWGNYKIKLDWGMQAIPWGRENFLFISHTAQLGAFRKTFGLDWYIERRKEVCDFLALLEFDGEYHKDFIFPAKSIFALIKLYPEKMADANIS